MAMAKNRRRILRLLSRSIPLLLLTAISLVTLYPFIFVILASFKGSNELRENPLGLPAKWLFSNYATAWAQGDFSIYFKNSLIIVIPVVLAVVFCSLLASYAIILMKPKGHRAIYYFIIAGHGVSLEGIIIPLYFQMVHAKLLNNPISVIMPQIGLIIPFGVLLLTGFIAGIPSEIIDAARVDGATEWQVLFSVVTPISSPGIVALIVFSALWTWNQFLLPIVMLTETSARTLPVGLSQFAGAFTSEMQLIAAGTLITAVPVIVVYLVLQNQFIRGITVGAMK